MALRAAFPSGPITDDDGNLSPAWRGFFQSLYTRTGDANGVSTAGLAQGIAAESVARADQDAILGGQIAGEAATRATADTAEASARAAADANEAAARSAADASLEVTKVALAGDTMTGTLIGPHGTFTTVQAGSGGATWTSGTGAPTATAAIGSLFSRTDGTIGSTLYVSAGGGTWNAVAGV